MSTSRILQVTLDNLKTTTVKFVSNHPQAIEETVRMMGTTCATITASNDPCEDATFITGRNITCPDLPGNISAYACQSTALAISENLRTCIDHGMKLYDEHYDPDCLNDFKASLLISGLTILAIAAVCTASWVAYKLSKNTEAQRTEHSPLFDEDEVISSPNCLRVC